jgi:DNA-binding CsgD family transcriptional regulator
MLYYYTTAKTLLESGRDVPSDPYFKIIWQGVVLGGIAQAYYLMGKYEAAIPLLKHNIASSTLYKQWSDAALAQNTLADIYFAQQKSLAALGAYKKAYKSALQVHDFKNLAHATFGIARHFKQLQLYDSGWSYYERYHAFSDSLSKITDRHLFALVNVKSDYDQLESTLQKVQVLSQRQKTVRNLIIAGIATMTIFILLLYNRRILQAKLEAERLKNEKQLAEAKAALSEEEITFARQQLRDFSKNLSDKNKLIENLQAQFASTEKLELNEMLRNFTILTGNDWLRFKDYFEKANPGYWQMLHQKLPNLSITEQRLFAFLKLGLGYKEMASATGVSAQSVRVALHRLRKKLEIAFPGNTVEEMATKL